MFNVYSEMRRKNILHKATGQGVVAFKDQKTVVVETQATEMS
jgi:DNA-binding transcriptional regulator YhcF (GntR family)